MVTGFTRAALFTLATLIGAPAMVSSQPQSQMHPTAVTQSIATKDAHVVHQETKKTLEEHCETCPPELGVLGPSKVYHADRNGNVFDSAIQKLTPQSQFQPIAGEACDRDTDGMMKCLYPGQSIVVEQPLTRKQQGFVQSGKASLSYIAQHERTLTKEQNSTIRQIWSDGIATHEELMQHKDILPKNAEGMPYTQPRLLIRLGSPDVTPCEYIVNVRADACVYPAPEVVIPPPVIETPAPYCGDGIIQIGEECEVGMPAPEGTECIDCKLYELPAPVVEIPPITPEFDERIPPIYARGLYGEAGELREMIFHKPENQNCPTADCTEMFARAPGEGTFMSLEAGYKSANLHAAVVAEKADIEVEQLDVSNSAIRDLFANSYGVENITLKARGAADVFESIVQPYAAGEYTMGEVTLGDRFGGSRTDDVDAWQATAGLRVAGEDGYNGSHAYIGGGIRNFDVHHMMTAPTYATGPATFSAEAPIAEAGGQVTLFDKHVDIFADATYILEADSPNGTLDEQLNYKAGANVWIDNNGKFQWGLTGEYRHTDELKLDMPGPPVYMQNIVPDDVAAGGVIIRFGW